jgi:hypothetical protein
MVSQTSSQEQAMARQSPAQKATMRRVMEEFKEGDFTSSTGRKVTDRRQAVAIGLNESGASNQATPEANRRNRKEAEASVTRAELYRMAAERGIQGRSRMSKEELRRALKGH